MNTIKGFVSINTFVDNRQSQVGRLGELSLWSETYSREKTERTDILYPDFKLTVFKSIKLSDRSSYVMQSDQVTQIFEFIKYCLHYNTIKITPYDSNDFRNDLSVEFNGLASNINIGQFLSNGIATLPEWISWQDSIHGNDIIKVWLSDDAFREQYDEYEIEVIPPVADLSVLFGSFNSVKTAVESRTLEMLYASIDNVKNSDPETYLRVFPVVFSNPLNTAQKITINWNLIIYGKTGDQLDVIKEKITSYVLANSNKTLHDWENLYPELFKKTEFVIIPLWNKLSIPNLSDLSALYGSIINCKEIIDFVKTIYSLSIYPTGYIDSNIFIMPYDYKALSLAILPGVLNTSDKKSLSTIYADYIPVSTASLDFSRMNLKTQEFVLMLGSMIVTGENLNNRTGLPPKLRLVVRSGIEYISGSLNNITYLLAVKSNNFFSL